MKDFTIPIVEGILTVKSDVLPDGFVTITRKDGEDFATVRSYDEFAGCIEDELDREINRANVAEDELESASDTFYKCTARLIERSEKAEADLTQIYRICGFVYKHERPVKYVIDQIIKWNDARIDAEARIGRDAALSHHFQSLMDRFKVDNSGAVYDAINKIEERAEKAEAKIKQLKVGSAAIRAKVAKEAGLKCYLTDGEMLASLVREIDRLKAVIERPRPVPVSEQLAYVYIDHDRIGNVTTVQTTSDHMTWPEKHYIQRPAPDSDATPPADTTAETKP